MPTIITHLSFEQIADLEAIFAIFTNDGWVAPSWLEDLIWLQLDPPEYICYNN